MTHSSSPAEVPKPIGGSAAQMLDALSVWAIGYATDFPIRSAFHDNDLARAAARCNDQALETYRATRSTKEGFEAGRKAFLAYMDRFRFADLDLIRKTSRRSTPDLWLESLEGEEAATG